MIIYDIIYLIYFPRILEIYTRMDWIVFKINNWTCLYNPSDSYSYCVYEISYYYVTVHYIPIFYTFMHSCSGLYYKTYEQMLIGMVVDVVTYGNVVIFFYRCYGIWISSVEVFVIWVDTRVWRNHVSFVHSR